MTEDDTKDSLCVLVAPWLPDATIDELHISESCGCYSEWTTEPPRFEVTFKATHGDEVKLSKLVGVLEPLVRQWAESHYHFTGCQCCQGEDYAGDEASPSVWVRVIRQKSASKSDAVARS